MNDLGLVIDKIRYGTFEQKFEGWGFIIALGIATVVILLLIIFIVWLFSNLFKSTHTLCKELSGTITDFQKGKVEEKQVFTGKMFVSRTVVRNNTVVVSINGKDVEVSTSSHMYRDKIGDNVVVKELTTYKKGKPYKISYEL